MRAWQMGRITLIEVERGYAVFSADVYYGQLWQDERRPLLWHYESRPLGPPFGSVAGVGFRTAGEAADALVTLIQAGGVQP